MIVGLAVVIAVCSLVAWCKVENDKINNEEIF